MTRQDRQLLLQDLCGRLPYGVKVQYDNGIYNIDYISVLYEEIKLDILDNYTIGISEIKPYLRPMSSMTEEEKVEYTSYCFEQPFLQKGKTPNLGSVPMCIDWLNAHYFDYRGLIPKGLAISTEEFNPYNN